MNLTDALAWLDAHQNLEVNTASRVSAPTLDRMERLMAVMGDPQHAAPVIHITGTNGKGSTAAMCTALLVEQGLTVGTYTSPHLTRLNERISRNGEPIDDADLAEMLTAVADLEVLAGVTPSWFEIVTAAGLRWFADVAVDVAVVEVGLLGRWDATNVCDARVAVVTNIGLDHTEYAGPTTAHIAREKAGIVKPDSTLVVGEVDPELVAILSAPEHAATHRREIDFDVSSNLLAIGGRALDLTTPLATYPELYLPLHGHYQGDNAAVALTAVESFFEAPLDVETVRSGLATVRWPGRFEVLGHQPLVVIDGAHNPAGAAACAEVLDDDLAPAGDLILVVGFLEGRDPGDMLRALGADAARLVVCCTPPTPRGRRAAEVAEVARQLGAEVVAVDDVARACRRALDDAGPDDAVLVTGSLYVVGAARPILISELAGSR